MTKPKSRLAILLTLFILAVAIPAAQAAEGSPEFATLVGQLSAADYAQKRELIEQLARLREPNVVPLLTALLEGRLQARDTDMKVVIVGSDGTTLTYALTGAAAGTVGNDSYTSIGVNNQLRKSLRGAIAQQQLSDTDESVRLAAVTEMLRSVDAESTALLRSRAETETSPSVKAAIATALDVADLGSEDIAKRLAAVESLRGNLSSDVFNKLTELAGSAEVPDSGDPDAQVRAAARTSVHSIQNWRNFYGVIETLLFGLSLGSVLVLAGIGLAVTFGVMGVINMAHGELMMLGAYTVYVVQLLMPNAIGASIIVAIPAAFIVSGLMGVLIERGIVRFLYGRPLETLLATFGVSLILQQLVRDVFSPNNRPVETPQWMAGSLRFNDVLSITYSRMYIILFTLAVFFLLLLVLRRTRLGLEVRAVSQNRNMAKAMGIRTEWVDALTFGLGSGIAGVAGVALSQLTNVGPNLGQSYIVDSFMVVVFGGVGSLWGTQIGGTSLGVINKLLEPAVGAVLAKIFVLAFLILFIQRRPRGLFPQKGRAAEG
ncbi:MAG: urea ABC transporter permease subunit UrtB [Pseudomonadota bacterium]